MNLCDFNNCLIQADTAAGWLAPLPHREKVHQPAGDFLPVAEWVLTRYSGFCQRQVCSSKLTVAVAVVSFSQQIYTRELTLRQFKVFQIPNFGLQFA